MYFCYVLHKLYKQYTRNHIVIQIISSSTNLNNIEGEGLDLRQSINIWSAFVVIQIGGKQGICYCSQARPLKEQVQLEHLLELQIHFGPLPRPEHPGLFKWSTRASAGFPTENRRSCTKVRLGCVS